MSRKTQARRALTAVAQLPSGGSLPKGRSVSDLAGVSTYTKPQDDNGTSKDPEPGSIHRKDYPSDLAKPQEGDQEGIDHSKAQPSTYGLGPRDHDDYTKPRRPYYDYPADTRTANWIAQEYIVSQAPVLTILAGYKTASTSSDILAGLNPDFNARSLDVKYTMKRVDVKNLRWLFSVAGSKGAEYAVKIKAIRPKKNVVKFSLMDLEISCSCPAWKWLGPEFHAKDDYLLGKARGTASTPDVKDPKKHNRVCKHVAAILNATKGWTIPVK